jgi:glutamate racemase
MDDKCSKEGSLQFFTTDSADDFDNKAAVFYGKPVISTHLAL